MAIINDPTASTGAKVSLAGALHVTDGGDGFPSYRTRIGSVRFTAAMAANTYLWAIRAPATRTLDLRFGYVRLAHDPVAGAATTSVIEFVRFRNADPAGGTLLTPVQKSTLEPLPQTTALREAAAGAAVTLTGAIVDPAGSGFNSLNLPNGVSAHADVQLDNFGGFLLAPGEGLALRVVLALPVGSSIGGFMEFSERT